MKTEPLYLADSYLKEMTAQILEAEPESEGRWKVILDKTVFYPMGGGQPTDQGMLYSEGWQGKVYQVLLKDGDICHYVEAKMIPSQGTTVRAEIDWKRRYYNMRLHSAGHVVDFAIYLLGYSPQPLMPQKADHGKKPTIWYQGAVDRDFREELEAKANRLVTEDLCFSIEFVSFEELKERAIYLQPGLPTNKPLRLLTLESVGSVADGGTQVHTTGEVGAMQILPIEVKELATLIRYSISG